MEAVNSNNGEGRHLLEELTEVALRQRVAAAIAKGGGVAVVSRASGVPKGTVEKYAAETSTPSVVRAGMIAKALGISLDQLISPNLEASDGGLVPVVSDGMIRLPVYSDVRASAGPGAAAVSERSDSVISFDPRFLRDQGAAPERCSVIWAHGDSMMPTIPDGSALIVDQSQTEVRNGSIMVIGVGDDLMVKRVRRRLDGLIDLISDNSAYAPETLGPDSLRQLRVIGRVVYFCRTP